MIRYCYYILKFWNNKYKDVGEGVDRLESLYIIKYYLVMKWNIMLVYVVFEWIRNIVI